MESIPLEQRQNQVSMFMLSVHLTEFADNIRIIRSLYNVGMTKILSVGKNTENIRFLSSMISVTSNNK